MLEQPPPRQLPGPQFARVPSDQFHFDFSGIEALAEENDNHNHPLEGVIERLINAIAPPEVILPTPPPSVSPVFTRFATQLYDYCAQHHPELLSGTGGPRGPLRIKAQMREKSLVQIAYLAATKTDFMRRDKRGRFLGLTPAFKAKLKRLSARVAKSRQTPKKELARLKREALQLVR